ncbi:hypothetical protein J7413_17895 [Shimia sp. R10_1]|uniref:hypothetical protein n=1 Tax=Shimia sp. R10_1 TaxID=2821095 RepID=UPI001ADAF16D|nr:hypothetical protein [Shimia sp. R10_1]MBO9475426.1 hypothetical protein [Shimia sp. R10_1]
MTANMTPKFALLACALIAIAPTAQAQPKKFVGYTINAETPDVTGVMLHEGYNVKQVIAFVQKSCKGGKIGPFALATKTHRKGGFELKNFKTTCPAGPASRFNGTQSLTVEHELLPDGRTLTEYFYVNGGESKRLVEFE